MNTLRVKFQYAEYDIIVVQDCSRERELNGKLMNIIDTNPWGYRVYELIYKCLLRSLFKNLYPITLYYNYCLILLYMF